MPRIVLKNFGPVKECDLTLNDFMVFTGPQASGKSTIAKAVYFFRAVKHSIFGIILDQSVVSSQESPSIWLKNGLLLRFYNLFSAHAGIHGLEASYYYSDTAYIRVFAPESGKPGEVLDVEFSDSIQEYLSDLERRIASGESLQNYKEQELRRLSALFSDPCLVVFIPAGRSYISIQADSLSRSFSAMDEMQRLDIDFCIRVYVELIRQIRASFSDGLDGILRRRKILGDQFDKSRAKKAKELSDCILKGSYQSRSGIDVFIIGPDNQPVKMNQASSGQQEAVWITNFLFYYLTQSSPVFMVVEEPESNLYPDTQKHMTELLTLFKNAGHQVLITTHSPYVLGTLNNLIYASDIAAEGTSGVEKVIDRDLWLDRNTISAWYMKDGKPQPAIEPELGLIRNEYIDGASEKLTDESDALYELTAKEDAP